MSSLTSLTLAELHRHDLRADAARARLAASTRPTPPEPASRPGHAHDPRDRKGPHMDPLNAPGMVALGGAIATDVVATFVVEAASHRRDRRLWAAAAAVFVASLALLALALRDIPTSIAEAVFVAVGSAAVAVIAVRRGEHVSVRKATALALLVLGVVVLQAGAGHG